MRIAFVGKGGSGKSVIAGTVGRLLAQQGHRVLALDFDTMPGLAYTLGLPNVGNRGLPEDLAVRRKETGWNMRRRISAQTLVKRHAAIAPDGVRFLQLGKLPDGVNPGASFAFRYVAETFDAPGWSIVGDLAAGTRQSFFGWAKFASVVAIIVEPSPASIMAARRLRGLRELMPPATMGTIVSKLRPGTSAEAVASQIDLPIWGVVPYDRTVRDAERNGRAVIDLSTESSAVAAITECLRTLQAVSTEEDP